MQQQPTISRRARCIAVKSQSFRVPSPDPGITLFVRNKRPVGKNMFPDARVVLFVHGSTWPGTFFDVNLPGGSFMDKAAEKGFCAYALDIRGYGRSTRPASMDEPPENNPPYPGTDEAVRDVKTVVDWIRKRHKAKTVNLVGWSWGGALAAKYTAENPGTVERLALFAPLFILDEPQPDETAQYREITYDFAVKDRLRGIPEGREKDVSPLAWFNKSWKKNLATDDKGMVAPPPYLRAPNCARKEFHDYWGQGKTTYDPEKIAVPTFIAIGEWDATCPVSTSLRLFGRLTGAPYRRMEILPEMTHMGIQEKHRLQLFKGILSFLLDPLQ